MAYLGPRHTDFLGFTLALYGIAIALFVAEIIYCIANNIW